MKHNLKITWILITIFLLSQAIGLAITNEYIDHEETEQTGNVTWSSLPYNIERPQVDESSSFIFILSAILLGTLIVFLIIKFKKVMLWKLWFFFAVAMTLLVAFRAFIPQTIAGILALVLATYKIFRPNIYIHNLTELFIYGGLAAIFVPIMNIFSAIMLLLLISIYDMIAVWKSKHMVKLANFQTRSNIFAGLFIPYDKSKKSKIKVKPSKLKKSKGKKSKLKTAVLGGGDIGFPLIFAGAIMKNLVLVDPTWLVLLKIAAIPIFSAVALGFLLFKSKKNKFYPAMPFISAGCLFGYGIVLLLGYVF